MLHREYRIAPYTRPIYFIPYLLRGRNGAAVKNGECGQLLLYFPIY